MDFWRLKKQEIQAQTEGGMVTVLNTPVTIAGERTWIDVAGLEIDTSYQPPLTQARVDRIATEFSWDLFQAITVNVRDNGRTYVIDGQHRVAGCRKCGSTLSGFDSVPATVFRGMTLAEESRLFVDVNNNRRGSMPPKVLYQANLTASDEATLAIQSVLDATGQRLGSNNGATKSSIAAVNALYWMLSIDGTKGLTEVFDVIMRSYPADNYRWTSPLPASIAQLLFRYPGIDKERLISRLMRTTARNMVAQIEERHALVGEEWKIRITPNSGFYISHHPRVSNSPATKTPAGVEILKHIYNAHLRSAKKRLE